MKILHKIFGSVYSSSCVIFSSSLQIDWPEPVIAFLLSLVNINPNRPGCHVKDTEFASDVTRVTADPPDPQYFLLKLTGSSIGQKVKRIIAQTSLKQSSSR